MSSGADLNIIEMVDQPSAGPTRAEFIRKTSDPVKYFGFTQNPFLDNVNPDFFFRTEAHEDAYLKMKKCIEDSISMGLITAMSGTGKTLLTQILLQELDQDRYVPALVLAYPRISRSALLRELAQELDISKLPQRMSLHNLINVVQERIFELHHEGKKPVFLIDEVHFLGGDTLHLLRTLSNIETAHEKLVTILLFGEEFILEKLDQPKYRAILSRTFIRAHLRPLLPEEMEQYVKFRCLMAGGSPDLFDRNIFSRIHKKTGGIPREVNRFCHNAIRIAAESQLSRIDSSIIEEVIKAEW
jgi:general secretion pathway protein A